MVVAGIAAAVAAAALSTACQEVPAPRPATAVGAANRVCYFGSERAFELAWYDAVKNTGCTTLDGATPTCSCPTTPLPESDCDAWGVNLFRLYEPEPGAEDEAVMTLVNRVSATCDTYGGIRLPEDAAVGLEPDGGTPACQKTATAGSPDIAVYTAFIVIATLEAAFLTFEHTRSQPALAGVEKTE